MRSLFIVALGTLSTPALAAFDAFLLFPGIPGESTAAGYTNHIELVEFGLDAFRVAENGSVATAGTPQLADLTAKKSPDIATPLLMLAAMNGTPSATPAEIKLVRVGAGPGASTDPFMTLTLVRPIVTSFSLSGSGGDDVPTESFSIGYDELCITHRPSDPSGNLGPPVTRCWDATAGAEGSL